MLHFFYKKQKYKTIRLYVRNKKFTAIVADSFMKKLIGLMFRDSLKPNHCMLFIFGSDGYHGIWMKNMKLPIDVVWLDNKKRIISQARNLLPCRGLYDCENSKPTKPARYVIEFAAGTLLKNKVTNYTKVLFSL